MCGPPAERPQARVNVERAVAEAFEYRAVNEDEIVAAFLARGEEGRRIAGRGVGEGGVGVGFGAGRVRRGVRCRSDMLW